MTRGFVRFVRANTIALLALFIALSGTTYAAATALAPNSVGTVQLKKNAVTAPKIRKGAVTTAKIKNNAVTGAKVLESSLKVQCTHYFVKSGNQEVCVACRTTRRAR